MFYFYFSFYLNMLLSSSFHTCFILAFVHTLMSLLELCYRQPAILHFLVSLLDTSKLPISQRFIRLSIHKATIGMQSPTIRSLYNTSELLRLELIRSCTTVLPQSCVLTGSYTSDSSQCIPLVYLITTHFGLS